MMKALVPLNNTEHIDDYIKAGAGEFYIGFYDETWREKFGDYADINRLTGFGENANPYSLQEVIEIINLVKEKGAMIYVTFNASLYAQEHLRHIEDYMKQLKSATDIDGVIVSCPELVDIAVNLGISTVISTISGVYNSDIAKFYKNLGAKRIILPRDLSVSEIEAIIHAVPDMEYEIFMMRNGCRYSDGNCLGFHRSEKSAICGCIGGARRDLHLEGNNFKTRHEVELNDIIYTQSFHSNACGLCSIYRFVKLGIAAGKIVGRSDEWQYICRDIQLIKQNVEIAKGCRSEEEYLDRMILPEDSALMCKLGLSCYYPEVRF